MFCWFQRVKAHGIHPELERLIYLTDKEFKLFNKLRGEFTKRAERFSGKLRENKPRKPMNPIELCSLTKKELMGQEITRPHRELESIYWSWQRVKEYYRQATYAERYERLVKEIKT